MKGSIWRSSSGSSWPRPWPDRGPGAGPADGKLCAPDLVSLRVADGQEAQNSRPQEGYLCQTSSIPKQQWAGTAENFAPPPRQEQPARHPGILSARLPDACPRGIHPRWVSRPGGQDDNLPMFPRTPLARTAAFLPLRTHEPVTSIEGEEPPAGSRATLGPRHRPGRTQANRPRRVPAAPGKSSSAITGLWISDSAGRGGFCR